MLAIASNGLNLLQKCCAKPSKRSHIHIHFTKLYEIYKFQAFLLPEKALPDLCSSLDLTWKQCPFVGPLPTPKYTYCIFI